MKRLRDILDKPVLSASKANKKQLHMGIEVEKEHTSKKNVAQRIALAHLKELPDYYTRLKKVEKT